MKKYKLIAFDIDGTILDSNHIVCANLIDVVKQLKSDGYLFTLVSARMPQSVIDIAANLGIDNHIISLNGSLITDSGHQVLYSKKFPFSRVREKLLHLDKNISRNYYHEFDWIMQYNCPFAQNEIDFLKDSVSPVDKSIPEHINKLTLIGERDLLEDAKKSLADDSSLLVGYSNPNYLEVSCNTISKFHGLEFYAKTMSIPVEEVIAFGDGENDMPMLAGVGLGVAMGNAKEHVKKVAKDVAGNNFEQGVANYLTDLLLK